MIYNTSKIAVTTEGTEGTFDNSNFFDYWAVYPIDGDITVEIFSGGAYGGLIYGFNGVGIGDTFKGTKIRIKAISGTVNVAYYLRG